MPSVLWLSTAAVLGMTVAVGAFLLRGIAAWLQRRWKAGVDRVAFAIGWFVVALVTVSVVATRFVGAHAPKAAGPEEKARLLAEIIAEHVNAGFLGLLLGLTLGALLEWRTRRAPST